MQNFTNRLMIELKFNRTFITVIKNNRSLNYSFKKKKMILWNAKFLTKIYFKKRLHSKFWG